MTNSTQTDTDSSTGRFVLVVDDHELVRNLIVTILEDEGFSVLSATSGPAAIELFRERSRDVGCVLQDLSMPKMRGEEVIAELLELDPDVRIIVMSVDDESSARRQLNDLEIVSYLQKPFEPEILVGKIRTLLSRKVAES